MTDETVIEKAEQEQVHQLLAELRHGPVPLAGAAERDAQRQRLLPALREQVSAVPRVRQRRRSMQRGWLGAGLRWHNHGGNRWANRQSRSSGSILAAAK